MHCPRIDLPKTTLSWLVLFVLLAPHHGRSASLELELDHFDRQAHLLIGFQATVTAERFLEELGVPRPRALTASALGTILASVAKERFLDAVYDPLDVWAGALGAGTAVAALAFWPSNDRTLSFEPEGGFIALTPAGNPANAPSPPASLLLHAQNTLWYRRRVGLHFFSGGMQTGRGVEDRRLLFGVGVRVSLLHRGSFSIWSGADYGFLLFAADASRVPYQASGYSPFLSVGLHWHPGMKRFHLGGQLLLTRSGSIWILGSGVHAGFEF
ncbi:MAG: hypothetical protein NDJ89_15155 [Oligoflexia bacterium]|nr:hypothetical protein [Oligoflexia bacterium]